MDNSDFWNINKEDIEVERKEFKIKQIKLEHFYFNSGDIEAGMPISTSLELKCNYDFTSKSLLWKKTVVHNYISLEDGQNLSTDSYEEEIKNGNELIKKIEEYDLRELKNNYFSEEGLEKYTHWEITYNKHFKIVGTYDNEILEYTFLSELLNFREIRNLEIRKIQDRMNAIKD
ncbi:MAG: hypothetical protein OSJ70_10060 [Bacilli bacterium]|nr:hypothetical protein [Bacilli bacterium]